MRRTDIYETELAVPGRSELVRLRRGTYQRTDITRQHWEIAQERHALLLGAVSDEGLDGVVGWESAVLLHGGRTLTVPGKVDLIRSHHSSGLRRPPTRRDPERPSARSLGPSGHRRVLGQRPIVRHCYTLGEHEVVTIEGLRVTSLERTLEDCARFLPADRALAAADSLVAVAAGAGRLPWGRRLEIEARAADLRRQVEKALARRRGERGVRQARAVVAAMTPLSQSVWESELRRLCLAYGIVAPEPQMPVRTRAGEFYADLGWREARLVVEVDGAVKYQDDAERTLRAQEWRERAISDAGFLVIRFTPETVCDGSWVVDRLRGELPRTMTEGAPVVALRTAAERRRAG